MALFNARRRRIIYTLVPPGPFLQQTQFYEPLDLCRVPLCSETFSGLPLSPQDDSDEEPSTAVQTPERDELMEYVSLSCEEGEEMTSSEVWPRGPSARLIVFAPCLRTRLFNLSRTTRWRAAIPSTKSGKVTAQGLF